MKHHLPYKSDSASLQVKKYRRITADMEESESSKADTAHTQRLLLIDNSGSTSGATSYWENVRTVYNSDKFDLIYGWNTTCTIFSSLDEIQATGGTTPRCFFDVLLEQYGKENTNLHLVITTDGQISQCDIEACTSSKYNQLMKQVSSVVIYYFGYEHSMNLGLNVVFGSVTSLRYAINSTKDASVIVTLEKLIEEIEQMSMEEVLAPRFTMDVISRVRFALERGNQNEELQKLRSKIIAVFDKFLHSGNREKLKQLFENDEYEEYVDAVLTQSYEEFNKELDLKKQKFLSCFDKNASLTISHFTRYQAPSGDAMLESTKLVADSEEAQIDWTAHTDEITFDDLATAPCLLMHADPLNITFSNHELTHPFAMLRNEAAIKSFLSAVEPHILGFDTIFKITAETTSRSTVVSPFTRQTCHVIVIAPKTTDHLKFNSTALSRMFGNEFKLPGNLILWNFVALYLVYKHKELESDELKETLLRELRTFCETFKSVLTLSIKCLIKCNRVPLVEALWFCCRAVPMRSPNSVANMLRLPFGVDIAHAYLELFPPKRDHDELLRRAYMWQVWNYFMRNRGDKKVAMRVTAQYQNYAIHGDSIILLSGPCETRFPCPILNPVPVDTVYTLFVNCKQSSKTYEAVNKFTTQSPKVVYKEAPDAGPLYHVEINPKTCCPYVICKKTNKHWRECIGKFDAKGYSLVRLFYDYVHYMKAYPSHSMDLVLFFFEKTWKKEVLPVELLGMLEYVFRIFKDVMDTVDVKVYLSNYVKFKNEKERLKHE